MTETAQARLNVRTTIAQAYGFMRGALVPTLLGTATYAFTSLASILIIRYQTFGEASYASAVCMYGVMALIWFSMALRRGTGQPSKGLFGMSFGRDEIRLGLSTGAVLIVLVLVGIFIGFFLFLFSMSAVAIAIGGFSQEAVLESGITESAEATREFLFRTQNGRMATGVSLIALLIGLFGYLWLIIRLLPYAPTAIAQQRVTALEAMVWTRLNGRYLFLAFLATGGFGLILSAIVQWGLMALPIPPFIGLLGGHFAGCLAALLLVGFASSAYRQLVPLRETTGN